MERQSRNGFLNLFSPSFNGPELSLPTDIRKMNLGYLTSILLLFHFLTANTFRQVKKL